jgi:hypothetical protein
MAGESQDDVRPVPVCVASPIARCLATTFHHKWNIGLALSLVYTLAT